MKKIRLVSILLCIFIIFNIFCFVFEYKTNKEFVTCLHSNEYKTLSVHKLVEKFIKEYYFSKLSDLTYTFKYYVFKTSFGDIVIGKDGWLFYKNQYNEYKKYLDEYEIYAKKISFVQKELNKRQIDFLYLFVPDKAFIYSENLPLRDKIILKYGKYEFFEKNRYLIEAFDKYNINYYNITSDYKNKKKEVDFNLFANTGCHWTLTGVASILNTLFEKIKEKTPNISYPKINIFEIKEGIYNPDIDLIGISKVYKAKYDKKYTIPIIEYSNESSNKVYIYGTCMGYQIFDVLCNEGKPAFQKIIFQQYFESRYTCTNSLNKYEHFEINEDISNLNIMDNLKKSDILIVIQFPNKHINDEHYKFFSYLAQEFEKEKLNKTGEYNKE